MNDFCVCMLLWEQRMTERVSYFSDFVNIYCIVRISTVCGIIFILKLICWSWIWCNVWNWWTCLVSFYRNEHYTKISYTENPNNKLLTFFCSFLWLKWQFFFFRSFPNYFQLEFDFGFGFGFRMIDIEIEKCGKNENKVNFCLLVKLMVKLVNSQDL